MPHVRFHPVQGRVEFATLDDVEAAGPDYRFTSPELADLSRTDTEAGQVVLKNQLEKLKAHEEADKGVVRNSVQAQASVDTGHIEPL
jgi:hypothetical protein